MLLAYFHYCNKGIYPFSRECREQELRALAELDDARIQFVRETRDYATDHSEQAPSTLSIPLFVRCLCRKPCPRSCANAGVAIGQKTTGSGFASRPSTRTTTSL